MLIVLSFSPNFRSISHDLTNKRASRNTSLNEERIAYFRNWSWAKPRNQKNGEKWWNLKVVEGLRSGQSFESVVGACACVCSTGECPPLLGFGWDFLVNPSSSLPASPPSHPLPSELFAAELCAEVVGGREGNEEKERAVEVWKREWMTRRTREIDIRNPCAVGHRAPLATPRPMA